MRKLFFVFILLIASLGLFAQWSSDPSLPNQIYSGTSAQVMPKTAITQDGHTWIAWMDNTTGNYNTFIQRLNFLGESEFTSPVLVSNHPTATWLTEWDIDSDPNGNAILCFQDLRLGTANTVIYKVTTDGTLAWGADGILLSHDTSTDYSNYSPVIQCLSDGRTVAGWQRIGSATEIRLQSLSSAGDLQWGEDGIAIASATANYTWPQIKESLNGSIIVKYYEDTGPAWAPTRHLLVQRFLPNGTAVWTNPTAIQNTGGINAWTQLIGFVSDNAGGAFISWHDYHLNSNIAFAYVQHVTADGAVTMPQNGVQVTTNQNYNQFYPKISFDSVLQEIYAFWVQESGNQDTWSLQAQKLSLNGERLWSDQGLVLIPTATYPIYPLQAMKFGEGTGFLYTMSPVANNDQVSNIKLYVIDADGQSLLPAGSGTVAATNSHKLHYDQALGSNAWGVVVWEDGNGPSSIYGMRFNADGSVGVGYPAPYNLTAQVINTNDVFLHWEMSETFVPPIGYNIYRNNIFYLLVSPDATEYLIHDLGPGQWVFRVSALFADDHESAFSNEAVVNITAAGNEIMPDIKPLMEICPNPFQNIISINLKGLSPSVTANLSIYDLKGRLVRKFHLTGKSEWTLTWDGKDESKVSVPSGVYFFKLHCGELHQISRIIKY
ncbi:MAG TPA: T9SS type A sorting domain-containing protein [Candidatus Cloacimonadota bacterium]|nr:T9SS type A sorting domain-containing protein [Candidatus Cloacimonadota bacterium]